MKASHLISALSAASLLLFAPCRAAPEAATASAPAASPASGIQEQLQQIVQQVDAKIKAGKRTEADMADQLKQFDALLAKHKGEKTDAVAQVLLMKALLYVQVLGEPAKGADLVRQLKVDYPDTKLGKEADHILTALDRQVQDARIQASLNVGAKFPNFEVKGLNGKPLSIAAYKGKVLLVDFWATWCGPCVHELPNVLAAYKKYHDHGFDIVGISLDQDEGKLTSFIKDRGMTWRQYFDGKGWNNELALKYGIDSIPSTFLLDRDGTIVARDLRGPALEEALAKRLSKQ